MPIYEYECPKCGRFEVVQKVDELPVTKNPDCCQEGCPHKAERVMSAPSFHLKGTGWYKTDYKPSGTAGTAQSNSTSKPSSTSAESATASSSSDGSAGESGDKKKSTLKTGGGGCGSGCGCH